MERLLPWFRLKSVPGVGNHLYKRLIDHFQSPDAVFHAPADELGHIDGMSQRVMNAIRRHTPTDNDKRELDSAQEKGFEIVTLHDDTYPPLLREIPDPPPFLYVNGQLDSSTSNLSIVGSRNATTYGLSTTRQLGVTLAALDITIVSGMALGIDTAAHEGALQGKGKTIAVLGSGLERIYPPENRNLFHRIAENGAVISEFPLKMEPEGYNFPIRNRIISGCSMGTVVVEATQKSGSLITARLAAEQNREVFAVPGSIRSFKSMGTHTLIKEGAKLVENAQDILDELGPAIGPWVPGKDSRNADTGRTAVNVAMPPLSADEKTVFDTLGPYPLHVDEIVRKVSMAPGKVLSILLQLELSQHVQQSPGKLFSVSDTLFS
ncbi:MAG: DNA-processing protein DprA [Desulfobacterales bacterium]